MNSKTITKFYYQNDTSTPHINAEILNKLRQFHFVAIDDLPEEQSIGWTSFDDMLDTEFNAATPNKGEYIAFALRIDTRRIPSALLKKELAVSLKKEDEANREAGKKYISRERKKELSELAKLRLMRRLPPVPKVYEVVWNPEKQTVFFGGPLGRVADTFSYLFTRSFGIYLEAVTPYSLAANTVTADDLDILKPTNFAGCAI